MKRNKKGKRLGGESAKDGGEEKQKEKIEEEAKGKIC